MWSDRETLDDLLGFHLLVESLMTLLTEPRLIPVTIGIDGDWGSGKSSLLKMAAEKLPENGNYIAITFSPWMHEDYDDIKVALITTLLRELRRREPEKEERINALLRGVRELGKVGRFGKTLISPMTTAAATSQGIDPAHASALGTAAEAAADKASESMAKAGDSPSDEGEQGSDQEMLVAEFREKFRSLMEDIKDDVAGVVVFIDDVDRCLPEAVVDTFEAIRLFSDVEATAFVVAAHRSMVEAAIDARYARLNYGEMPQGALGNNYLEKMWHITLRVPPLSAPEVETYLNLLLCELHLSEADMNRLRGWVRERDPSTMFTALNQGTIEEEVGELPDQLVEELEWVSNIAHAAAEGLRGNPRQVKRFVNRLRLFAKTLDKLGKPVKPAVLAKLLLLDELDPHAFATLMRWTIAQSGKPVELEAAENPDEADEEFDEPLAEWVKRDTVETWLGLEPPLAGVDLLPYVHVGQERATAGRAGSRLTPELQGVMKRLDSGSQTVRRQAVQEVQNLGSTDQDLIKAALLDVIPRAPRARTTESALQIAETDSTFVSPLVDTLKRTDSKKISPALPMTVASRLSSYSDQIRPVLEEWAIGTSDKASQAAKVAIRHLTEDQST